MATNEAAQATDPFSVPEFQAMFAPAPSPQTPEDFANASLTALRGRGLPMWQGALWQAIAQLMQRLNASPQGILGATGPQANQAVQQAQRAKQQTRQRLGPMGGGQTPRAETGIDQQLAQLLASLFGGVPQQAQNQLGGLGSAFSRVLPPNPTTQTSIGTQQVPGDPQLAAQGLYGLASFGKDIFNWWNQPQLGYGTGPAPVAGEPVPFYYP